MRESGIDWLGQIPDHWTVGRLRDSVEACVNGVWGEEPNGCDDVVCVRVADFARPRLRVRLDEPTVRAVTLSERRRRLLKRGDLLLEKSGGGDIQPVGAVMLFDHDVSAVCSNFVGRMPVAAGFDPEFLVYLHSHLYAIGVNRRSVKQSIGIQNLDSGAYLAEHVAFPPVDEQHSIARFLDHADRQIRRAIRGKQKLIVLLNEQAQAVIHRAVTRGLDPNVRMKASGVDWLGDVPEHWKCIRLRRVTTARCDGPFGSGLTSAHYVDSGVRVVRLQNIGFAEFKGEDRAFISAEHYATLGDHSVEPGDVLIAGLGDPRHPAGRASVAPDDLHEAMVKADCFRFRLDTRQVDPHFMAYHLSATAADASAVLGTGATRHRVSLQSAAARWIALPPLNEQREIARFVGSISDRTRETVHAIEAEIDLLREYRARLIADAVTGKLDVRAADRELIEA